MARMVPNSAYWTAAAGRSTGGRLIAWQRRQRQQVGDGSTAWLSNPLGDRRTFRVGIVGSSNGSVTLDVYQGVATEAYEGLTNLGTTLTVRP